MKQFDVILVDFPNGPRFGGTSAEAVAKVFGISQKAAEKIVKKLPTVVRRNATREEAKKYYDGLTSVGGTVRFEQTKEKKSEELTESTTQTLREAENTTQYLEKSHSETSMLKSSNETQMSESKKSSQSSIEPLSLQTQDVSEMLFGSSTSIEPLDFKPQNERSIEDFDKEKQSEKRKQLNLPFLIKKEELAFAVTGELPQITSDPRKPKLRVSASLANPKEKSKTAVLTLSGEIVTTKGEKLGVENEIDPFEQTQLGQENEIDPFEQTQLGQEPSDEDSFSYESPALQEYFGESLDNSFEELPSLNPKIKKKAENFETRPILIEETEQVAKKSLFDGELPIKKHKETVGQSALPLSVLEVESSNFLPPKELELSDSRESPRLRQAPLRDQLRSSSERLASQSDHLQRPYKRKPNNDKNHLKSQKVSIEPFWIGLLLVIIMILFAVILF